MSINSPPAIAVDSNDRIVTLDYGEPQKILILSLDGNLINSSEYERDWPFGNLDLSPVNGEIFILDKYYQKMNILNSELKHRRSFDIYAKSFAGKMVIDKIGNIYLYDRSHAKVKVYDSEGNYLFALPLYPFYPSGGVVSNDVICIYDDWKDHQNQLHFYNLRNKKLIKKHQISLTGFSIILA